MVSLTFAQTPQYYNFNNGTSANSFPFNMAAGKAVNTLFLPGAFNQPAPLPSGYQITAVYFRCGTTGTRSFTNLHILMAQDTITSLTMGTFYPGPYDTVFAKDTSTSSTSGGWMKIQLSKPFVYDPNKSLITFVGQCGYTGTGTTVYNTTVSPNYKRIWSVGGCPFTPYSGGDASTVNFGVDVEPAVNYTPEVIYYKFENNPAANLVLNCANPGAGVNPATVLVHTLGPGGQFDSCMIGTGATNSGIATGWATNLGSGSWTISMWLDSLPNNTSLYYLWGETTGSFRCFLGGAAGAGNVILRGTGITDVVVSAVAPGPTAVTYVYDSATATIYGYKNGVLANSVVQTPLNLATGTGFKVGAYSTSAGLNGKMDEFRVYKRALSATQVAASWNMDIACGLVTGMSKNIPLPETYMLCQNYPNPFNPTTKIGFALPRSGFVTLKVYDILGKEVATLINEYKTAGNYIYEFNASNLSTGIYFYTLNVNGFTDTKKMLLIK